MRYCIGYADTWVIQARHFRYAQVRSELLSLPFGLWALVSFLHCTIMSKSPITCHGECFRSSQHSGGLWKVEKQLTS